VDSFLNLLDGLETIQIKQLLLLRLLSLMGIDRINLRSLLGNLNFVNDVEGRTVFILSKSAQRQSVR